MVINYKHGNSVHRLVSVLNYAYDLLLCVKTGKGLEERLKPNA